MNKLSLVMFDVDGTLIDSLNFIVTVVNKVCVKHGQSEQSADFIKDGVGLSREKSLRRLFPEVSDVELMQRNSPFTVTSRLLLDVNSLNAAEFIGIVPKPSKTRIG